MYQRDEGRLNFSGGSVLNFSAAGEGVWISVCVCVCVIVTGVTHTHTQEHTGPFLPQARQNFLGCVCWNRVPLYARGVCRTHSCTQAGALIRTSDRAGAAHTGVNQHAGRSQRFFDSFLYLRPVDQQTATVPKDHVSVLLLHVV